MLVAVIPAYNEASRVGNVVSAARKYVDAVIVVDDGSTDDTSSTATKAGAQVIRHGQNGGAGAATMTGLEAARRMGATAVVTLDADEQHDPADIPRLLEPVQRDAADIVFANRFGVRPDGKGNRIPLIRRFFNGIGNVVTLVATGKWVQDSQSGYKVFGPKALAQVDLRMSGFEFCTEIVREAVQHKWRIAQVPTKVLYSEYTLAKGQSFGNGVKTALKILLRSFLR
ncbi:MAG: glycosyltransferase family 2 protein [Candidatus Peribacteraceae bacterium]|nr:glycosyltransferase family 2 protein [Candidatus Peribacteraceae bacterium]